MQKVKLAVLALIAVFALGAVMVASASAALPEFKTKSGNFPVSFKSGSLLPLQPTLETLIEVTESKQNITCEMSKDEGSVTGAKEVKKVLVDYTGCKEEGALANACTTSGDTKGLIRTEEIMGLIGYITGTAKAKVGTELLPETSGGLFAKFKCEGEAETVEVKGCLIGEASPLNKSSTTSTLLFLANATDMGPQYTELEGGIFKPCELTVKSGFLGVGKGKSWNMDNELETFTEEVELKA